MECVLMVLAVPLVVWSLILTFAPHRSAVAATAPVEPSRWVGRVLAWFATAGIFAATLLLLREHPDFANLLTLTVLSRYGVLSGLFLVGLVPLALQAAPSLLANLFVLRRARHLFHIAWLSVLVASEAVVVCRVEEINGPARFGVQPLSLPLPDEARDFTRLAAVLILCLPLLLACGRCSREAFLARERWGWGPWLTAGLLGLAFGLLLMVAVSAIQPMLLSPQVSNSQLFPLQRLGEWMWRQLGSPQTTALYPIGDWLAHVLNSPGYTVLSDGKIPYLAPGHAQAGAGFAVVLAIYTLHYLLVKALGVRALHAFAIPALFLLLLLVMLLGFFLQGAAFALDLYRIPASLAVALFAFAFYQFSRTDHLFSLGNRAASGGVKAIASSERRHPAPELRAVAETWREQPPARTLVAVTASGGGIQASAWTARVLVGLNELYGPSFMRSIRLMSAVSGGSVGTMYALDAWPPDSSPQWRYSPDSPLPADDSVCGRAMRPSLDATAWGIVFPDLLRILAPWLVSPSDDRGARIEEAWRGRMNHPDARMTDWVQEVVRGTKPIPIFNATIVETGQRFLASPVLLPQDAALPPASRPRHLFELYPGSAPLASTMVRLSATFPFVSPICRPDWSPADKWPASDAYHFADGGYVDNEGMITIVEYLMHLIDPTYLANRPFDRVLLVRLMPFPSSRTAPADLDRGWFYAALGPIDCLGNVRTASQQERNDLAVRLLTETAAGRGVEVQSVEMRYDMPGSEEPPLSWMLTSPQKAAVDQAWRRIADPANPDRPLGKIDGWFPRVRT